MKHNILFGEKLTSNEKILLQAIIVLSKKSGACWASNSTFARLLNTSESTIKRTIAKLKEKNLLFVEDSTVGNCTKRTIVLNEDEIQNIETIPFKEHKNVDRSN